MRKKWVAVILMIAGHQAQVAQDLSQDQRPNFPLLQAL